MKNQRKNILVVTNPQKRKLKMMSGEMFHLQKREKKKNLKNLEVLSLALQ